MYAKKVGDPWRRKCQLCSATKRLFRGLFVCTTCDGAICEQREDPTKGATDGE